MFIGNETCKLFNHNLLALEQRNYFIYSQLCSLDIMQGSPAPSFLSPTLADYIAFGELSRAQSRIDDVFDKEVMDKLKELKIIEDPEEFKRVASFECALRFDAGFCKPIVTIEDKVKMLYIITLHYTLLQSLAEVNQFIEGLKLSGLLECMRQHPYEARKLFIYENNQISGEELDDLFGCRAWKQQKRIGREGVDLSILPGILKMSMMQRLRGPFKILTQRKNLTLLSQQAWCYSSLQAHIKRQLLSSILHLL